MPRTHRLESHRVEAPRFLALLHWGYAGEWRAVELITDAYHHPLAAQTPPPYGPGVDLTTWGPIVLPSQMLGAFLLLVGSIMYTVWAWRFGRPAGYAPMEA